MSTYQGEITSLGNSVTKNAITTYTIIEIGDQVIQKIKVPNSLDNFLVKSLQQGGTTKLYINGSMLVGVTLGNGKSYCYKAKPISGLIIILFGILTIPLFGLGFIYIWHGFGEFTNHSMCKELVQNGATQISL